MRKYSTFLLFILSGLLVFSPQASLAQEVTPVQNVILIIGDGLGFEQLRAASLVEYGSEDSLFLQTASGVVASEISTDTFDNKTTDSAAGGTAISTGWKTELGMVGMLPNGTSVQNILEYSESLGKHSGIVTTDLIYHATGASFGAHIDDRNQYDQIWPEMLTKDIEVMLGGGGLIDDSIEGYEVITTRAELLELNTTEKVIGRFDSSKLDYVQDINFTTDVKLTDMISPALSRLSTSDDGFFLMVEQALIDKSGHARDLVNNVLETIELDYAVKIILDWMVDNPDTLLIVTSDHETGGLTYESEGNLTAPLPDDQLTLEENRDRRIERINGLDMRHLTTSHTGVNVPLYVVGKNANLLVNSECEYQNVHVYDIMKAAIDGVTIDSCPAPFDFGSVYFPPAETTSSVIQDTSSSSSSESEEGPLLIGSILLGLSSVAYKKKQNVSRY